mmetsp:Transcript_35526/g.100555  ORF Transcript_35526/g.100555 Transcript_35526/m.100555 type:complete len:167 (-) Transcript_35526:1040-1540(-)
MPSAASRLKARLQSANHSAGERWMVQLFDLEVSGLPDSVKFAQFVLRRRDNKKKMQATPVVGAVESTETRESSAAWSATVEQHMTIYRSHGKMVPKYYELVVCGSESQQSRLEVIGRITVDIAEYCTEDQSHQQVELELKTNGTLQVCCGTCILQNDRLWYQNISV